MASITFVDYLNERNIEAFNPEPTAADNFVEGQVISIKGELFLYTELDKSPYKDLHKQYLGRLQE
ncbi:hypothetical protein P4J11_24920 [Bacillus cereus]|uniref:hypothetical protein n=1 Tax=Bacillus TaxID=1386 RepID=UPI000E2FEF27|nr:MULTISPECIES: hypothetical protein [Bacillus]MCB4848526.1 hypothetical protein [Bacillus tropicus]MCJ0851351.1 hypothetical protein [Bacillus cereus]MCS6595388.1 hypothetical protein [Bacillus cereus]MDA2052170.1 hypothetical protein [Bacillus cereus]MDA2119256.1 hypothetical protein [Bacillus cereus]